MNELTYLGDVADQVQDRIMGPDFYGAFYKVTEAHFDGKRTKATLKPCIGDDLRNSRFDEHGQRFLGEAASA